MQADSSRNQQLDLPFEAPSLPLRLRAYKTAGPEPLLEAEARALLRAIDCKALAKRVRVLWNPRLSTTAGMAYAHASKITLNPLLQGISEEEIQRTLRHELAHLVVRERHGRRRVASHGAEWRQACAELGIPGETSRHTLPFPRRTMQPRHFYQCPACSLIIQRVRPLKRREACIVCCRKHNGGRYDARFRFVAVK